MMDWTDRHCRVFHRLIAPEIRLYTEMVTTGAILHGEAERFLRFDAREHPLALQLGGSDPDDLARAVEIAAPHNYDEINLNCGCPSDRVQKGRFGACLMKEPNLVAACIKSMRGVTDRPVTVKCRLGIDDQDSYEFLKRFVEIVANDGGCRTFILHARKAWLHGLSPKENREVPPLDYERVLKIKEEFPSLDIHVNGGLTTPEGVSDFTAALNGAMIGRAAYQAPWTLREFQNRFYPDNTNALLSREEIVCAMMDYATDQRARFGTPMKSVTRHMVGLFQGMPGARAWRQALSDIPAQQISDPEYVISAMPAQSHDEFPLAQARAHR